MKPAYARTKRRATSQAKASQIQEASPADIWRSLSGSQKAAVTTFEAEELIGTRWAVLITLIALGLARAVPHGHEPTLMGLAVRDFGRLN